MITKKQKEIFDFVRARAEKNAYAPSLAEIQKRFGFASVSTAHYHISKLKKSGFLKKQYHKARAISIAENKSLVKIPLVGVIVAGQPIEAIETPHEPIAIARSDLGASGSHYALRVQGDSMIGEGIFDGDVVVIRKEQTAQDGQTVVAIIDEDQATLKKIYREKGRFRLQPANQSMLPIWRKEVEIRGVVVRIIRNLESQTTKKNAKHLFTFIDLFAGIGGVRIAFERVGGKCVFTSEWDEPCQTAYEANFGDKPYGDITKLRAADVPDHDILTGGFPCQSFSIIGHGKGFADTRGTLFFDVERILKEKRPRAFLLENVKQLVGHDQGRTFQVILDKLRGLGYFTHYKVLNGLDFGVPQKRERVMIVGFQEDYPFEFPKNGLETKTLTDILESDDQIDKKHFLSDYFRKKLKKKLEEQNKTPQERPSVWHENKGGNIGMHPYSCALRANGSYNYLTVNGERRLTPREMLRLQGFPDTFKIVVPDTQARKQAGNSVVIPKIEAVARAMIQAMSQEPRHAPIKIDLFNAEIKTEKIYAR